MTNYRRALKQFILGMTFANGKEIRIKTYENDSLLSNGQLGIFTRGSIFPEITLECGSSISTPILQNAQNEIDMKDELGIWGLGFGICSADETWSTLPDCFEVEEVSYCGNTKGIFCGSVDSFDHDAIRRISIPDGDGVFLMLHGSASLDISEFEGICYKVNEEDRPNVSLSDDGKTLDVIFPRFSSPNWSITLMNEGDTHPTCTACTYETCEVGASSFDVCDVPSPIDHSPSSEIEEPETTTEESEAYRDIPVKTSPLPQDSSESERNNNYYLRTSEAFGFFSSRRSVFLSILLIFLFI